MHRHTDPLCRQAKTPADTTLPQPHHFSEIRHKSNYEQTLHISLLHGLQCLQRFQPAAIASAATRKDGAWQRGIHPDGSEARRPDGRSRPPWRLQPLGRSLHFRDNRRRRAGESRHKPRMPTGTADPAATRRRQRARGMLHHRRCSGLHLARSHARRQSAFLPAGVRKETD